MEQQCPIYKCNDKICIIFIASYTICNCLNSNLNDHKPSKMQFIPANQLIEFIDLEVEVESCFCLTH